jgi:hypothetical protein
MYGIELVSAVPSSFATVVTASPLRGTRECGGTAYTR